MIWGRRIAGEKEEKNDYYDIYILIKTLKAIKLGEFKIILWDRAM